MTLAPVVAIRQTSVAARTTATATVHLPLEAREMDHCETTLVCVAAVVQVQTSTTLELRATVPHASVAACTLMEMGHRGTSLVPLPTETTVHSETSTGSSETSWSHNMVFGEA